MVAFAEEEWMALGGVGLTSFSSGKSFICLRMIISRMTFKT